MAKKKEEKAESLTYEEKVEKLKDMISKLQSDKLPLREAVGIYKDGMDIYMECREELESAKEEIEKAEDSFKE
jgi:exodeoxyribonuclease VII small subunit